MKKIYVVFMLLLCGFAFAKEITISVGAGENWKEKREPQFAIWLEDEDGNYVKTLYVTTRASKSNWIFAPKQGRPESLPVWYHSAKIEDISTKEKQELDAITSATPKGGIIFNTVIEDKTYIIKAEFNNSFDYNDFYTKKNSGVNGQPSVVYQAELPKNFTEEITLDFVGIGTLDGSNGKVDGNSSNLTTAKNIVKCVAIVEKK